MTTNQPVQESTAALPKVYPNRRYTSRMRIYLREMYPVPVRLIAAALLYTSFTASLASVQAVPLRFDLRWTMIGILGGFLLPLILRLMDELKDSSIDRRLFPGRPVPSGRVQLTDIRNTLVGAATCFVALHLVAGDAFFSSAILLIYSLLMYRYFFLPPVLKSKLLINLGTHNPIVALLLLHYVCLFSLQNGLQVGTLSTRVFILVGMYWALFLAWELGRKVRYAEEETDYQTYSKIFGPVGAALLTCFVQTLSVVAAVALVYEGTFSTLYLMAVLVAYVLLLVDYYRFLTRRFDSGRRLRRSAEQFATLVLSAGILELIFVTVKRHAI